MRPLWDDATAGGCARECRCPRGELQYDLTAVEREQGEEKNEDDDMLVCRV